jgi:glycosyltransferase involved in cell wall biosynthesis
MRRVLHIGPCDTPGGMSKVMHILAENPPEGWKAELLPSHKMGNPLSKWFAYRKAMKKFHRMLSTKPDLVDLVHVHTAADWSWKRKERFVKVASKLSIPCIIHIHSGKFETWLSSTNSKRSIKIRQFINQTNSVIVVLNSAWKEKLQPYIGYCNVIYNPVDPKITPDHSVKRDKMHLLLMGRNDPVKGHNFAIKLGESLLPSIPELKLSMTGIDNSNNDWVNAKGWISEQEKLELLRKASLLIVPSAYEGQPLAILEALACGLPCLASDKISELPGVVDIAEYQNIEQWTSKVKEILSKEINSGNLISASKQFNVEEVSKKWKMIYDNQFN